VPFDASRRTPAERAQMLVDLGVRKCAYDWREEHVASFEEEILEYQKRGIEFFAFWSIHDQALPLFKKHGIRPQLWQTLPDPGGDEETKVSRASEAMIAFAQRAAEYGLPLGLYNHGGWGGEPANMVAVCQELHRQGFGNVGIVFNFHHGHDRISTWKEDLQQMLPYLLCVNLNGMNRGAQPKILAIGQGQHESQMLQQLLDSGYSGPVGIIDHQEQRDTRQVLEENLDGLRRVVQQLNPPRALDRPEAENSGNRPQSGIESDPAFFRNLAALAERRGDADRGAAVFGSDQIACISCHCVSVEADQTLGGSVGPELAPLLPKRNPEQIVRSIYLPQEEIEEPFRLWQVLTVDGAIHSGYRVSQSKASLELLEISSGKPISIASEDIDAMSSSGSPMPDGLMARLSEQQQLDLIAFLLQMRASGRPTENQLSALRLSMNHGPSEFPVVKAPLCPERWPNNGSHVNRDRVYDFYTKQAEHFRGSHPAPLMLTAFPGLDGGDLGHWGNQNESTWADGRLNDCQLGSLQSGVIRSGSLMIPRGICLQLGEPAELYCCFDPDTLSYPLIWKGKFLQFSAVRYGLMDAINVGGEVIDGYDHHSLQVDQPKRFLGLYRFGSRVAFAYEIGQQLFLDSPWVIDGQFVTEVAPLETHSLRDQFMAGGDPQWPEQLETPIRPGSKGPLIIDTIELPFENPWSSLLFSSGHGFLPDGSAMLCTAHGDVWHVQGLIGKSNIAQWKRFASGLHQPLGLLVDSDGIFVQCRDQLVRLIDLNGDGEADYYECYSNAFETSPAAHDYICDLQRDNSGNFYMASGNQGLVRISADGTSASVVATGFRNPDGVGILEDGTLTIPCSEGDWTPASMICAIQPADSTANRVVGHPLIPHFGYGGPRSQQAPSLPLVYLPRGLDNSSGGQAVVSQKSWGPLYGQLLHLSFGAGTWFSVLVDEIDGHQQGCVVPLTGDFKSGVHRGRFNPVDGHFYVSGMKGWGTYTDEDGCFQRVRFSGEPFQHPVAVSAHRNGVLIEFAHEVQAELASQRTSHFAQAWNYRYSGAYGSLELSPSHPGTAGHDTYLITQAVVIDSRSVFLEIPEMQPVSQLHLRMHVNSPDSLPTLNPAGTGHDLFLTVHRLKDDFDGYPGYERTAKSLSPHPMTLDMATLTIPFNNPHLKPPAQVDVSIEIKTGKNLSYQTSEFRVGRGQSIALTLSNPDVVPHNWVLIEQGRLAEVGQQVNQLIASAEAYARHYVPESPSVLAFTDMVMPSGSQTIFFRAPKTPGRYPFLCTFPGHWMVMNGIMIVD
jgi:putative heme-binding domain-containing protein